MSDKTKNIVIICLVIVVAVLAFLVGYLIINKGETLKEITGKVIVSDEKYVIIESDDEDYIVNGIEDEYELGDEVKFTYRVKDLDEKSSPKVIRIESEKLVKKADLSEKSDEDNGVDDEKDATIKTEPIPVAPAPSPTGPTGDGTIERDADTEVMGYFESLDTEFKTSSIKESLKNGFITVVDFIFYGGSIKGHTFAELSESAKLKVLSMAMYFDSKIDEYFPGYKESISSTTGKIYTTMKEEIVSTYLNVTVKICESNGELCDSAKAGFGELKKNFGLTWSLIKDIAGDGLGKLKSWYEIFSGK